MNINTDDIVQALAPLGLRVVGVSLTQTVDALVRFEIDGFVSPATGGEHGLGTIGVAGAAVETPMITPKSMPVRRIDLDKSERDDNRLWGDRCPGCRGMPHVPCTCEGLDS